MSAGAWPLGDQDGYALRVCSCEQGPYLGTRRSGTPCCCERCGYLTPDQWTYIRRGVLAAAMDALGRLDVRARSVIERLIERAGQ